MKSGYVAVIGRANAGKSTLINVLVGEKVSIVSPKPQTTRDRILGIKNGEGYQIIFVDTPGIYKADSLLNSYMQKLTEEAPDDTDLILFVCDVHAGITDEDISLIKKFSAMGIPFVLGLTKIDIMPESLLISQLNKFSDCSFPIVPLSARRGKNIKELIKVLVENLPEGESIFGDDVVSDRSEKFMISEIMREKILFKFEKEIPHGVAIIIKEFELRSDKKVYNITLDIICEKDNHKAILVGKGGNAIKQVSSLAREEMEKFLGKKVFLTTYVLVKNNWRNSASYIKQFGYSEE